MKIFFEITRDSVSAGDDVDAPHRKHINLNKIMETKTFIEKISQKYLPNINGENHKWECLLNGKTLAIIEREKIIFKSFEIEYFKNNKVHFKYYPARD